MNILLSHLSLNFFGGEEKLCLSFIEALKSIGHRVTLFTIEKTDWTRTREFFGNIVMPDDEIYATSVNVHARFLKASTLAFAYASYLMGIIRYSRNEEYDLTISTYGDIINSIADLTYVHFPIRATLNYSQIPAFTSSLRWGVYCKVYSLSASILDRLKPSILLTNSKFTKQVVCKYLRRTAYVLHPPVDVKIYADHQSERENRVITVSKFTPKRHLYRVPMIAKKTKNAEFVIVGEADEYSQNTMDNLEQIIRKCDIDDRVTLLTNVPRSELINLLASSKAYLHVMPEEHFGISIIEAMASGCIPVVHRSGGPWLDMLSQQQGKSGFSYTTLEEAAKFIDRVMTDQSLSRKLSVAAQKRAWDYDKSVFQEKLASIVDKLSLHG